KAAMRRPTLGFGLRSAGADGPLSRRTRADREDHPQLDVAYAGGRSQADEGDRILLQELRLARDRRSGLETRDEVMPEHDRTVTIGTHVEDRSAAGGRLELRLASDRVAAEPVDPPDDEAPVIFDDAD